LCILQCIRSELSTVILAAADPSHPSPRQVSKRGKVASRPSQERTLAQLQAEQKAYEESLSFKQSQNEIPTFTHTTDDDEAGGKSDTVPTVITDRMLRRVVTFAGIPVFLGVSLLPFFYWLKIKQGVELPTWVVYLVQSGAFGGGLAGISYGILSASWEERREGTKLGVDEFKANLPLVLDRFKR
jgi:hypothetical protein